MKNVVLLGQFYDLSGYGHAVRAYFDCLKQLHLSKEINLMLFDFSFENKAASVKAMSQEKIKEMKKFFINDTSQNSLAIEYHNLLQNEGYELIFYLTNDWLGLPIQPTHPQQAKDMKHLVSDADKIHSCVVWETDSIPLNWKKAYNRVKVDTFLCASDWNRETWENQTGIKSVTIPYSIDTHCSIDTNHFDKLKNAVQDSFVLCSVGQKNTRKDFDTLFLSFLLEFKDEPVMLIFKSYSGIVNAPDIKQTINNFKDYFNHYYSNIKNKISEQSDEYKCRVLLIPDFLSREEMNSIYATSHCYISTSHAEGFGLPMAEFILHEKPIIAPNAGGHIDFVSKDNFLIETHKVPVLGSGIPKIHYDSRTMKWYQSDIESTRKQLRMAYEEWKGNPEKFHKRGINAKNHLLKHISLNNNVERFRNILEL